MESELLGAVDIVKNLGNFRQDPSLLHSYPGNKLIICEEKSWKKLKNFCLFLHLPFQKPKYKSPERKSIFSDNANNIFFSQAITNFLKITAKKPIKLIFKTNQPGFFFVFFVDSEAGSPLPPPQKKKILRTPLYSVHDKFRVPVLIRITTILPLAGPGSPCRTGQALEDTIHEHKELPV